MRVIAGKAKGQRLRSPALGTRPMTDRIKEAVFSALGDVAGLSVLDLYAGSGSLGLEALSRGAVHGTFVENAREAIVRLKQNIEETGFEKRSDVIWADVHLMLGQQAAKRIDLIFIDPPYSSSTAAVQEDLEALVMGGFLADEGRIVVHRPAKESRLKPLGLRLVWERSYGQSHVAVFAHEDE